MAPAGLARGYRGKIFVSDDSGGELAAGSAPNLPYLDLDIHWRQVRSFRLATALVTVTDDEIIMGYGDEVHLSRDHGVTWQVVLDPWATTFAIDAVRWGCRWHGRPVPGGRQRGIYRIGTNGQARNASASRGR